MSNLNPPSAALLPSVAALRERLAVALREVDLLRRLIRAAESVQPAQVTTADQLPTFTAREATGGKGMPRG